MLPKKNRISRVHFPTKSIHGVRVFSPLFSLVLYRKDNDVCASVVVSKKIAKSAVTRNMLRRRIYTLFEPYIKKLKPVMLVLYPKREALTSSFLELKLELEKALRAAKIIT